MRIFLFLLWIGFIGYAIFFAPGVRGFEDPVFMNILRMQSDEPMLLAVFSLMGVFPLAFLCILLRADRFSLPAWPFVLGSFVLGAFALLPYFFGTSTSPRRTNRTSEKVFNFLTNRFFLFLVFALALFLVVYGLRYGDISHYMELTQQSHFVHVMTIDMFVMCILSMVAIRRDRERPYPFRWSPIIGLVPVVGLTLYTFLFANRAHRG